MSHSKLNNSPLVAEAVVVDTTGKIQAVAVNTTDLLFQLFQ